MVFGHYVRGPLKLYKEKLLSEADSSLNIISYVSNFRHKFSEACKLAQNNLRSVQSKMKERYDRSVQSKVKERYDRSVQSKMKERYDRSVQSEMKERYDKYTQSRSFQPGDQVLALLPVSGKPLQARYFGPYIVKEKVSD